MVEYKIYTEQKDVKAVSQLVSEHYGGFTIYFAKGYWEGKPEKSMVIEIVTVPTNEMRLERDTDTVRLICKKIRGLNRQETVLFTRKQLDIMEIV